MQLSERFYRIEAVWREDGRERVEPIKKASLAGDATVATLFRGAQPAWREAMRASRGGRVADTCGFRARPITRDQYGLG